MLQYAIIKSHFGETSRLCYNVVYSAHETAEDAFDWMDSLAKTLTKDSEASNSNFDIELHKNKHGQLIRVATTPKNKKSLPVTYYNIHRINMVRDEEFIY